MVSPLLSLLVGVCVLVGGANATSLNGNIVGSPDCSLKLYRKPTGSIDTLRNKTNSHGAWAFATENLEPDPEPGETIYVLAGWNLDGEARTFDVFSWTPQRYPDLHLDKHTACIKQVHDSSRVNAELNAVYWIEAYAPETTSVDTGLSLDWKYDVHVPVDTLQAAQGESAWIRLEKVLQTPVGDSVFFRTIPFTISKERLDAQRVRDTVYFTRESVEFRPRDIGIEALTVPDTADTGEVVIPQALLENFGEVTVNDTAVMRLAGGGYVSRQGFVLVPGQDTLVEFAPLQMLARGPNVFLCSLPPDYGTSNDFRSETTFVRVRDAAAAEFVNPEDGDTILPFEPETVRVSVANAGNVPLETLEVRYLVTTDSAGTDTVYGARDTAYNVQPGVLALSFSEPWTPLTSGKQYLLLRVATRETGGNPTNDSLRGTCFVDDGTGVAGEHQRRSPKTLPTILRAPVDLRQVEGDLYDVLGRPAKGTRLRAGIYYLVAPGRTRKLLVVN